MGHGKPGKSWNFRISFSRPGKSWNLGIGFFCEENSKNIPKMKDDFQEKLMVKFRSWKTWRSHGKGHGKSWNFKSSKEYEPCNAL